MHPRETIARFDVFLADRGLTLEAVVIGGAALLRDLWRRLGHAV